MDKENYIEQIKKLEYQIDLLSCAVEKITKTWSNEEREKLANSCYKDVSIERYHKTKWPDLYYKITKQ